LKLFVFLLLLVLAYAQYDCKPSVNGKKYDFTGLQASVDYTIGRAATKQNWDVLLNLCTAVTNKACKPGIAICQVWDYNCPSPGCGSASLGGVTSESWVFANNQVVAKFGGGDDGRNSEIRFTCDPNNNNDPTYLNEMPTKEYNLEWVTKYGCPVGSSDSGSSTGGSGGGMDGGWVFVIIVLVGFSVYFIVGLIIKKVKFDAHGTDLIPNRDFWCGLPGLMKDGALFLVNKTCRRGSQSY